MWFNCRRCNQMQTIRLQHSDPILIYTGASKRTRVDHTGIQMEIQSNGKWLIIQRLDVYGKPSNFSMPMED